MMHIRPATPADSHALAEIHVDSWKVAYRGQVPDTVLDQLDVEDGDNRWTGILADPDVRTLLLEDDGGLIGFVTFGPSRDSDADPTCVAELWGIYLDPSRWRQGLGTKLCRLVLRELAVARYNRVSAWVLETNARARAFYEAMGFELDEVTREDLIGTPQKVVRYYRNMADSEPAR